MSLKNFIALLTLIIVFAACNSGSSNKAEVQHAPYVAIIDTNMTLMEVAKANNIGEPFLRTKLGLKKRVGSSFTIAQMSKRYRFDIEDLRKVIEDRKNSQNIKTVPKETPSLK